MFDIDDIVTLDNGEEYYLIDKIEVDNNIYFYAVKNKENIEDLIDSEYCFFLKDGEYLELVTDMNINKILADIYIEKIKN